MENGIYVMAKTRQKSYFDTNRLQLLSRAELFWSTHSPEPQGCALFWIFGLEFDDIFFFLYRFWSNISLGLQFFNPAFWANTAVIIQEQVILSKTFYFMIFFLFYFQKLCHTRTFLFDDIFPLLFLKALPYTHYYDALDLSWITIKLRYWVGYNHFMQFYNTNGFFQKWVKNTNRFL